VRSPCVFAKKEGRRVVTNFATKQATPVIDDSLRGLCINNDPTIILTYGNPMAGPSMLSPLLADRKVYFLAGTWWSYCDNDLLQQTVQVHGALREAFPLHQYILLTNDKLENELLGKHKISSYFCHHNAFLDESIFKPLPHVSKTMDAVYCARLSQFKRHELAKDIPSMGLVYYATGEDRENQSAYLRYLRHIMPGMVLFNHDPATDAYRRLDPHAVCRAYNRAKVGLCLSSMEGGNYATTEYQLCGLPVVSTPSQGGREVFLDPEISRIVPPTPEAVAQAVAELIALRIAPQVVRLRTLVKVREMRQDFILLVSAILAQEGKLENYESRFAETFRHKMLTIPGSPEQFLTANGLLPH
jgi:glycosyltransferase involved in cell wall biosynthesis